MIRLARPTLLTLAAALSLALGCADGCDCGGEVAPESSGPPADTGTAAPAPSPDPAPRSATPSSPEPTAPAQASPPPPEEGSAAGSGARAVDESAPPTITPTAPQLQLRRFDPASAPSRLDPRAVRPQVRDLRLTPGPITP